MRRGRIVLLGAVVVVAGLVAAALLVPLSAFRGPLEATASAALDRRVEIRGSLHLAVYPEFGISLHDVAVANKPGARNPQMVTVGKLIVGAKLLPLLGGRLNVTKVILKQPAIHLDVGRDGVANWQLPGAGSAAAMNPAGLSSFGLERARIDDGKVTYFDARTGKEDVLSGVSLVLTMPDPIAGQRGFSLEGAATYQATPMKFSAAVDDFDGFVRGRPSGGHLVVGSGLFDAEIAGRFQVPGAVTGTLKLKTGSLRKLAAWAGHGLPPGNGFGAASIEGAVTTKDRTFTLSKADITLDGMKLTGDLAIDTKPAIPALKGTLVIDHIDARPYLAPTGASPQGTGRETPLAFGGLKDLDADLALTIGAITVPDLKIDRAVVAAALHGGVLKAQMTSLAAYGGTGKGSLTLDASGAAPSFRNTVDMTGFNAARFLGEVMGISRISGTGAVHLDVTARGASEAAIVKSMSGRGSFNLGGGSISGLDLGVVAGLVQSTLAGQFPTAALGGNSRTEFSAMSASFVVQNGVVRTADLRAVTPAVEMTGVGTVNLATHQIDFRLNAKPRVGAGLVDIPFSVRGTWDNPDFGLDAPNLAKGIVGTVGAVGSGAAQIPGAILKVPGTVLDKLFGGN